MNRTLAWAVAGLVLFVAPADAADDIRDGVVKKVDPKKEVITLTVDGKDIDVVVTDRTMFFGLEGEARKDWGKQIKTGAKVKFKTADRDGQEVLIGLKPLDGKEGSTPGGIRNAVVKKVDAGKSTITLTVDGKDIEAVVAERSRFFDLSAEERTEWHKHVKTGSKVMFKVEEVDGKQQLIGLKFGEMRPGPTTPGGPPPLIPFDTSMLVPVTELGKGEHRGFAGGLYPEGKNDRPAAHEAAGKKVAATVQPLAGDGKPSDDGKIVLLSVGMSNTTGEFQMFQRLANSDPEKSSRVVLVDGAQGGMPAISMVDPESGGGQRFWMTVDQRLRTAGVTRAQVQVAWVKQADPGPRTGFPDYAKTLQSELRRIVIHMRERFPNLKLVYLSSRIYAGWAKTPLNPEPYAYESAFSVKWLIEEQIKGDAGLNYDPDKGAVKAPWLSWGPYLWANGTKKRADGYSYEEKDFVTDGTHPSESGRRKVAELLLRFFKEDSTTRPWFRGNK
jgi:Cu/Ag efflux protein CusF